MVQSLESYVAQATQAYQPAQTAIQNQINALSGQLNTTNEAINKNYAQQQAGLNNQRNMAAETASLQAAGSGGSFGGAANIANRKYYDQAFVPAVTQLRSNQTNELAAARQASEDQRTSLNSQLSNLQAQANQEALRKYWAEVEAEQQRAWEAEQAELNRQASVRAAAAQASAASNYYNQAANSQFSLDRNRNLYGGFNWRDANGNVHTVGTVAQAGGGDFNDNLASALDLASDYGDYYSQVVRQEMANGARFAKGSGNTGNAMYDTLGIRRIN